jgi:hypothetical protein
VLASEGFVAFGCIAGAAVDFFEGLGAIFKSVYIEGQNDKWGYLA